MGQQRQKSENRLQRQVFQDFSTTTSTSNKSLPLPCRGHPVGANPSSLLKVSYDGIWRQPWIPVRKEGQRSRVRAITQQQTILRPDFQQQICSILPFEQSWKVSWCYAQWNLVNSTSHGLTTAGHGGVENNEWRKVLQSRGQKKKMKWIKGHHLKCEMQKQLFQ